MLVVGFGKSGKAAVRYGLQQKMQVVVTDLRKKEDLQSAIFPFAKDPIIWHLGGHPKEIFEKADLIVASPGVPLHFEGLQMAKAKGVPVVSELELALQQSSLPLVGVTGTNGKTTTVSLIHHLLQTAGKKSLLAGNVGTPLLDCLEQFKNVDTLVLELSSFQLEMTPSLKPKVAVWLNVTEDHVDWHQNFEAYVAAKAKLVRAVGSDGLVVYNDDDTIVAQVVSQFPVPRLGYSVQRKLPLGAWVEGDRLFFKLRATQDPFFLSIAKSPLKGIQNWENMMAAVLAVSPFQISQLDLQKGLDSFQGLPHRMQWVRDWKGIHFVNDSKATNVGAVVKALEGIDNNILWLAGGRSKQASYQPLAALVKQKVRKAFFFGEAAEELEKSFRDVTKVLRVSDLATAVTMAANESRKGDTVLLSPACSSFDQFQDYADRGNCFVKCVEGLA